MTDDLRTRMHRAADEVTPLPVADDLWRRGQTARHRGQALVVAAVLVVLASVGGGVALWSPSDREARTASQEMPEGAIPRVIADVPDDLEATSDLAVGRASAAFISATGDAVVVSATDGVPHRLDLGGWSPDPAAFALSPDGRRLALQDDTADATMITLLDLTAGRTTSLFAHGGERVEIAGISWSPDGQWIGWVAPSVGDAPPLAGMARASADDFRQTALPADVASVAVANDGTKALGRVRGGLLLDPVQGNLGRVPLVPAGAPAAFSPDGRRLALATAPGTASYTLDVASREVLEHPFPEGTFGESVVRPLGWLDDRLQLLLVQETARNRAELVVTTPEVDATSTWRRSIGSVATTGVANSLSLAVDLIPDLTGDPDQELTHDFGDTGDDRQAPLGIELSLFIGLGVAAAIALLLGLRLLWRRLS